FPIGDFPVARLCAREARAEHLPHLIAAFHGLYVPCEGNEVAPVAFRSEHRYGGVEITCRKSRFEFVKKDLDARVERSVEHDFPPAGSISILLQIAETTISELSNESTLARPDFPGNPIGARCPQSLLPKIVPACVP